MKNSNFILLGVAVAYIVIAIIQGSADGTLSANIYVTVSFLSLELTILEAIKSITNLLSNNIIMQYSINEKYVHNLYRSVVAFGEYSFLKETVAVCEEKLQAVKDNTKIKQATIRVEKINKLNRIIVALQIVFCTMQVIITPLKIIPYDTITNKTINVVTLITFALMFFVYFVTNYYDEENQSIKERISIEEEISSYYLDIIDKINSEKRQGDKNESTI